MGDRERLDPEIAAHCTSVSEQQRLGPLSLERVRTLELLGRYLPPPPAVVLDIGGAAGIYALPLAAAGYQVHLVDPLAMHVQQARRASAEQPAAEPPLPPGHPPRREGRTGVRPVSETHNTLLTLAEGRPFA